MVCGKGMINRIGVDFNNEIEEIKEERLKLGRDKIKKSTRKLTNLILKHSDWKKIKEDLIDLDLDNKKGEVIANG